MAHPLETCPYCGNQECSAEWCDVGVGFVQMAPYHCYKFEATEIGPHDEDRPLSDIEKKTGWYRPGTLPDTVSSINGLYVDTVTAKRMYERGLVERVPFKLECPARHLTALTASGEVAILQPTR